MSYHRHASEVAAENAADDLVDRKLQREMEARDEAGKWWGSATFDERCKVSLIVNALLAWDCLSRFSQDVITGRLQDRGLIHDNR